MTTTAAGAYELMHCYVDEVDVCDKTAGRSYMPEYAYRRIDTGAWKTHSSLRKNLAEQTGEIEVLRKILPVNESAAPVYYTNETVVVYRVCPQNVSTLGDEYVTVIGRNFQDTYSLLCLWRPETLEDPGRTPITYASGQVWNANANNDDLQGFHTTVGVWESKTRIRCRSPKMVWNTNQTWPRYNVHVTNNGLNFSHSSGAVLPVNNSLEYNTTDPLAKHLTIEEAQDALDRSANMARCLIPVVTDAVDDAYPIDEEGYRQDEEGWFLVQAMGLVELTFDFTHLPEIMEYDEHYRIAIYVAPSVCVEQRCHPGGGRVRVLSQDKELDPPSILDQVTSDEDVAFYGEGKTKVPKYFDEEGNPTEYKEYDPLFDRMDNTFSNVLERSPCTRPIPLSQWFKDRRVDKHGVMNITVWALDDVIVKPEVQILNGMFLAASHFLRNITTVKVQYPDRANRTQGLEAASMATRKLHKSVSFEEREVPMQYIWITQYAREFGEDVTPPLNFPSLFRAYETGRVVSMFRRTPDAGDHIAPVLLDSRDDINKRLVDDEEFVAPYTGVVPSVTWWSAPSNSPFVSLMLAKKYRETFHGLRMNPEGTQPSWQFVQMALPYIPFVSNCDYYDSYIPIWHLFENEDLCGLPDIPDPNSHQDMFYSRQWERRAFAPFPHQDDIVYLGELAPFFQGIMYATADICIASFNCRYEELLVQADVTPRWFESDGLTLFKISQESIEVTEFLESTEIQRGEPTPDDFPAAVDKAGELSRLLRMGNQHMLDDLTSTHGPDNLLDVASDSEAKEELSFECTRLCFPRTITFEVRYWQKTPHRKKLIGAAFVFEDYDLDTANNEYEFGVDFMPNSWIELMIAFAFGTETFSVLFIFLSAVSMFVAFMFYILVRITTRLATPPRFRFTSMMMIIVPPAIIGVLLAMVPVFFTTYIFFLFLYGENF